MQIGWKGRQRIICFLLQFLDDDCWRIIALPLSPARKNANWDGKLRKGFIAERERKIISIHYDFHRRIMGHAFLSLNGRVIYLGDRANHERSQLPIIIKQCEVAAKIGLWRGHATLKMGQFTSFSVFCSFITISAIWLTRSLPQLPSNQGREGQLMI